jgi:hypothetical protein
VLEKLAVILIEFYCIAIRVSSILLTSTLVNIKKLKKQFHIYPDSKKLE